MEIKIKSALDVFDMKLLYGSISGKTRTSSEVIKEQYWGIATV